jgi:hypothetical protein
MSQKTIARAAVDGRKLRFIFAGLEPVWGYVVQMDDYHLKVACPRDSGEVVVTLVHKSCPIMEITSMTLASETDEIRQQVQRIGGPFFDLCRRLYLRKTPSQPEEQS